MTRHCNNQYRMAAQFLSSGKYENVFLINTGEKNDGYSYREFTGDNAASEELKGTTGMSYKQELGNFLFLFI